MRLLALDRVPEGAVLARDVVGGGRPGAPPLLRAGMRIAPNLAQRAATNGVGAVWIEDELGAGIEPPEPLAEGVRDHALRAVAQAQDATRRAMATNRSLDAAVLRELGIAADAIAQSVADAPWDPSDPAPADPGRQWHAVRVAALGLAIAARHLPTLASPHQRGHADRLGERLALLGTGLLAHDIGKVALPEALLARTAPAGPAEERVLERHTIIGEGVMNAAAVPVQIRAAIRAHHEHWDGSGRPDGKAGAAIHISARIAAVADAYDALITPRPYRDALAPWAAARAIERAAGSRFDPAVVEVFSALVMPYPVGHEVVLANGRHAVVAYVDAEHRLTPLVRARTVGGAVEEFEAALGGQFAGEPVLAGAGV